MTARRPIGTARLRLVAVVAALALALAGCATIPRSGPVVEGSSVAGQESGLGPVDYIPPGPVSGATQEEVLLGFIDAGVSPEGGYAIAKKFLTPTLASTWDPDASVTVDTGDGRTASPIDSTHMQLSVNPVASVDAEGDYRTVDSPSPVTQSYSFEKYHGQWRISKAPAGIVIDAPRFQDVFSPHPLYFFSPDYRYLVPDERWFPTTPVSTPTRVVKALTDGPAKWLGAGVTSAFPQGTTLFVDSVTVSAGEADVDLNSVAGSVDQQTFARMQLQLDKSLQNVSTVSTVKMTIEGVQRPVSNLSSQPIEDPTVAADPLVLKGGKFGLLNGSTVTTFGDMSDKVAALDPTQATMSADQGTVAALANGGVFAVRTGADDPVPVDSRPGLVAPSLDADGYVWSASASAPGVLMVGPPSGDPFAIPATWPGATAISAIAVSRDGTRLAALVTVGGQTHVMVAGIGRSASGKPDRIEPPADFGVLPAGTPRSLNWTDELTVAALTADDQDATTVTEQTIGGQSSSSPGPANGAVLVGAAGAPLYWVLDRDGTLQEPRGTGWQQHSDGISLLATQLGH